MNGIKGNQKAYVDLLTSEDFDVVMTYVAHKWTTDIFLENVDKIKAKKVIVPCGYSCPL